MERLNVLLLALMLVLSCGHPRKGVGDLQQDVYTNPIYPAGSSPRLIRHDGHYYYTQSMNDRVSVWRTDRIGDIATAPEHVVYSPGGTWHISAPQLHRIDGKWYLLFSSDDGSGSDIRHIYVMENGADDPLDGTFAMKGWIETGHVKDIHPTTFTHGGKRYLLWSGTDSVVPGKPTVWNIYISAMRDPWTLEGEAAVISTPQYEWECQWIDEDGTSYPAPSLVNEGPEFLYSRDSTRLLVYYAASETYTSYYCEGLLIASAGADPLDPASWHKKPEPVFSKCERTGVLGPGHLSFFRTGSQLYILYNGKSRFPDMRAVDNRSPRMQEVQWGKDGIPVLGFPVREDSLLLAPCPED
ncbi:MAG: glycoside hydrolase family 43 protein [Bacteroidales bacterium]|nr:glycoside hydrolase family 43 protein [Bacteroidales bacterium]